MPKDISPKEADDSSDSTIELVAGLDETGMGSLAGPLCLVVVAFPSSFNPIPGVRDSKKLTKKRREELAPPILKSATFFGIGWASPQYIDEKGVALAWQHCAQQALEGQPPFIKLIVDGTRGVDGYGGEQIIEPKADDRYWQVSAASVVAKVIRDRVMADLAPHYPAYRFDKNSGYGTKDHEDALKSLGPCPEHRRLFLRKIYARNPGMWKSPNALTMALTQAAG